MAAPKRFPDRVEVASVRAEAEQLDDGATAGATRRLAGRVMARRDMGKLVFLDLVDRSGRIQLLCPLERTGELDIHLGDVVGVSGSPAKSRRGEPSLMTDSVELLSRIRTPLPDTFHGLTDVELRYRKRYLDLLMNEESRDARPRSASAWSPSLRGYSRRRGLRRGRDADPATALRRALRRAVRDPLELARRATCYLRIATSSTSSA